MPPHFAVIAHFYARLVERLPQGAQIFDDNIILAQSYLKASPQHRYFPNSGISSLGHAIPAAIGARCAVASADLRRFSATAASRCAAWS